MHFQPDMMATVKSVMHNIGDSTGDFAKRFGSETAHLAKRVGKSTAKTARKIGPKRALIGAAVVGAVIGSVLLVRYLRARRAEMPLEAGGCEEEQAMKPQAHHETKRGSTAHSAS
jgi:hypothetical protein